MMSYEESVSRVTVRCPFCEKLFLMTRPLFLGERERTACPACRKEAEQNTKAMRQPDYKETNT